MILSAITSLALFLMVGHLVYDIERHWKRGNTGAVLTYGAELALVGSLALWHWIPLAIAAFGGSA